MKKSMKKIAIMALSLTAAVFTSCSGETSTIEDVGGVKESAIDSILKLNKTLKVIEGKTSGRRIEVVATPGGEADVYVHFTDKDPNMYRLYIAKNEYGVDKSFEPYEYKLATTVDKDGNKTSVQVDLKRDGSIDLGKVSKGTFTFNMKLPASTKENGIIQYVFWATKARGDFRDISNDNALPNEDFGTIIVKSSSAANVVVNDYKEFSAVILAAPLADGSSKTFISLFDNKKYAIKQGKEYAALWDFGYYYGATGKASLASAADYPSNIINVSAIGGTTDLNNFYMAKSSKTVAQFDAISKSDELAFVVKPTKERVTKLAKGNVVEFVDKYGNKGLIKITNIVGTSGTSGRIEFDVKVQVKAIPVQG